MRATTPVLPALAALLCCAALCACAPVPPAWCSNGGQQEHAPEPMRVVLDQDGNTDDLVALLMLVGAHNKGDIQLDGVVVTPADSLPRSAWSATRKLLHRFLASPPAAFFTALSTRAQARNAFPIQWRRASLAADALPSSFSGTYEHESSLDAIEAFAQYLRDMPTHSVTLVATGPLTTVALVLALDASLADRFKEVMWMGGAVRVGGNVYPLEAGEVDGSAEWNVYWDAHSARDVLAALPASTPLHLMSLDCTDALPLSASYLSKLGSLGRPASDLAAVLYAGSLVLQSRYYLWDVATSLFALRPHLFRRECVCVEVEAELLALNYGQTREVACGGASHVGKRVVSLLQPLNTSAVLDAFVDLLDF